MKEFLEPFFNFLQYCIENKIIEAWVALVLAVSVVFIYFSLSKIDNVTRLIGTFKNRNERLLIKVMQDEYSSPVTKECATQEFKRINNKKLCGFDDVIRQRYCICLADKYSELVTVHFFRKFRTSVVLGTSQEPLIKAGKMLWFEWWIGIIYTFQFFLLAIFFISLSVFNPGELPLWKHATLYLVVVVLLWVGVIMSKQFPSREEIKLLKEIKRREEQVKH